MWRRWPHCHHLKAWDGDGAHPRAWGGSAAGWVTKHKKGETLTSHAEPDATLREPHKALCAENPAPDEDGAVSRCGPDPPKTSLRSWRQGHAPMWAAKALAEPGSQGTSCPSPLPSVRVWCCRSPPAGDFFGKQHRATAAAGVQQHRGCAGMLCSAFVLPEDGKPTLLFIIHANNPAGGGRGSLRRPGLYFLRSPWNRQGRTEIAAFIKRVRAFSFPPLC